MAERASGEIPKQTPLMGHWLHFSYTWVHKYYVFKECLKYGLIYQGLVHDWTKFSPLEWMGYVRFHFLKEMSREEFDMIELAHAHRNPHHWQYWCVPDGTGSTTPRPIPDRYRKEMVADMRGASKAKGFNDILPWYRQNRSKQLMHPETRAWVDKELGYTE